jgi:acyl carrier protein
MEELEQELKLLLIEVLKLEDMSPDEIDVEAPLFGQGLGLDSLDALELAMAISKRYGANTGTDETRNRQTFASLRSLASFVREHRTDLGAQA